MAKKKKKLEEGNWLDTYADTVTLLLTFFVLLYSMSSVDAEKLKQVSEALNTVMTGKTADSIMQYDTYDGSVPLIGKESKTEGQLEADMEGESHFTRTYEDLQEFIDKNNLSELVSIQEDARGVVIQLKDSILFEKAKADIKPEAIVVLDSISTLIAAMPNQIIVEGHTDNDPISTYEYQSNWELSAARASRVLRYFVEEKGQLPSRFSVSSYGDTKPNFANTTEESKAQNRRVNILVVSEENGGEVKGNGE